MFQRFDNGAHCYKKVTIQYNGQKVQATVTDQVCLEPNDASTFHQLIVCMRSARDARMPRLTYRGPCSRILRRWTRVSSTAIGGSTNRRTRAPTRLLHLNVDLGTVVYSPHLIGFPALGLVDIHQLDGFV